ncbi:hypothetical protein N9P53_03830 [Flavobacteriaceae bacterium]|nr:hypothetical protein [Flavobacteriaceae bacterium]
MKISFSLKIKKAIYFFLCTTNDGAESGTVSWTPTATGTFYCQCSHQDGRVGTIGVQL